ncbi:MAG: O-antigen ligase family protein [Acholeplasmatales bacterium]|nr:O-antigen ligase family protein [Acholeplasmatales bacterium]
MISIFDRRIKKLNNSWIFEYVIVLLFIVFGFIGWKYSFSYSGMGIIVLTILLLFVFNDFKYIIPAGISLLFSYNSGYEVTSFPVKIAVYGGLLIFIVVLFSLLNFKLENFKKPKSYIGIVLLSISCMIPIFWNSVITKESSLMYFIYFTWVLYVVLYFVFGVNLGKNSLRIAIFTFSSLIILLSSECLLTVLKMHNENPNENILSFTYSLGWGICNEAGIMLCFCLPFVFYELIKTKNSIISIICVLKVFACLVGIVLTTSRAALLVGGFEALVFFILTMIFSKKKITNLVFFILLGLLSILFIHLYYGFERLFEDIKNVVFEYGFGGDGRERLYKGAYELWSKNWLNRILGSGIVSELEHRVSYGREDALVFTVYHSTFFETLVMGGIFGILCLLFHFYEKYKQLWKKELPFVLVMLVGYLAVDAYGMLDNTYGMYYYMVPLVILMASLDNDKNTDIFNYELIGA